MKLLFDENLSPRLADLLAGDFPGSTHIDHLGMRGAADSIIWARAREHGYTIVSKDNDFRQSAFLFGPPPKVIWLAVGNAGSAQISRLLLSCTTSIRKFGESPEQSLLVLELEH